MGTERTGVPPAAVAGMPAPAGVPDDPAALLLDRAALLTAARRGGRPPERAEPPCAAAPDPVPPVSQAAGRRLARMLGGEHPDLLAEWLTAAVDRGRRVPAHVLPLLLDRARRVSPADTELRRLAARAGGTRARWLAGLNPDWKFVTAHTLAGDDAWRLGNAGQRRGYLTALRARDPDAARELIVRSWDAAGPGTGHVLVRPRRRLEPVRRAAARSRARRSCGRGARLGCLPAGPAARIRPRTAHGRARPRLRAPAS